MALNRYHSSLIDFAYAHGRIPEPIHGRDEDIDMNVL